MDVIRAAETPVNTLESLSERITDEDERRAFRRRLTEVMSGYVTIQLSIARQYPDLDPDREPMAPKDAADRPTEPDGPGERG